MNFHPVGTVAETIPMHRLSLSGSTNFLAKTDANGIIDGTDGGFGTGSRLGAMSASTTQLPTTKQAKRFSFPPQKAVSQVNLSSPDKGDKSKRSKFKPPSPRQPSPRKAVSTVNLSTSKENPDRNKTFTISPKRASSHLSLNTTRQQPKRATPSPRKAISHVNLNQASPAKSDMSGSTATSKDGKMQFR